MDPSSEMESQMVFGIAQLQPAIALIAGVLILIMPRLLNYIVAIYLIVAGLLGLGIIS
jgi:Protein of unknown function (DUF3096)